MQYEFVKAMLTRKVINRAIVLREKIKTDHGKPPARRDSFIMRKRERETVCSFCFGEE